MPKGMGNEYKGKMQRRFILRVRELENDSRTERSWNYLDSEYAERAALEAQAQGFFTRVLAVLGRELPMRDFADAAAFTAPDDASAIKAPVEV